MFIKTLTEQGNAKQHELFLKPAKAFDIIGCYAQTELGHGSNVKGLETTATWDPETKEFVLHSPHLTASKWWIGTLGRTANHAVVMAQLYVKGKNIGPHPFVVQIRDMKTHEPLEGVIVGDIGPKFGYNTMDNGYLLLNHIRIPHINMFVKYSSTAPETSEYTKPPNAALVYGTLTYIRSEIVFQGGIMLARGATIAIRYCATRRQFHQQDATPEEAASTPEVAVLDYVMVQARLFPVLAQCFALHFAGRTMMAGYYKNQKAAADNGDYSLLADLHAKSCALKALASFVTADGLEVSRRACGGHGYSSFGGIGEAYATYLPTVTWEGDNYMLVSQVGRYLMKVARSVIAKKPLNDDNFTKVLTQVLEAKQQPPKGLNIVKNPDDILKVFAWRAASMTFDVLRLRDQEKRDWNSLLVEFWRVSTAYAQYLLVTAFHEIVYSDEIKSKLQPETVSVLQSLFRLATFHVVTMTPAGTDLLMTGLLAPEQLKECNAAFLKCLGEIRPHAVKLVDAWAIPDFLLDSSLGRSDGKVYEDLWERAHRQNPINRLTVDPDYRSSVIVKRESKL